MRAFTQAVAFALLTITQALFHHNARQASIILNNILYIDGGEQTTWDGQGNGTTEGSTLSVTNITSTWAINLGQSWANGTAPITNIPRPISGFQSGALWSDHDGNAFYQYDGGVSLASGFPPVGPNQLWKYSESSPLRWTQVTPSGNFSNLVRVQEGLYATGGGLGFALGGFVSPATLPSNGGGPSFLSYQNGMVMYNSSSQMWYNLTTGGQYAGKKVVNGGAIFVPNFGPAGLFIPIGGVTDKFDYMSMETLSIFEPLSQTWRTQKTVGDAPGLTQNPCVVGAAGDNGTYEIFVYGGFKAPNAGDESFVHVLSLPSFLWMKVPANAPSRFRHTCTVAPNGRQMISAGGIVIDRTAQGSFDWNAGFPDPWPNGLGVFDMTELQWTDQYNAQASNYVTAGVVKMYVQSYQRTGPSFDDPLTQSWFSTFRNTSPSQSQVPTTSSAVPSASGSAVSQYELPKGAIAGIAVGAVFLILLAAAGAFLIVRRSRRRQQASENRSSSGYDTLGGRSPHDVKAFYGSPAMIHPQQYSPAELDNETSPHEAAGRPVYKPAELDNRTAPQEVDGRQRYKAAKAVNQSGSHQMYQMNQLNKQRPHELP